jgi:hypothetical protein
VNNPLDLQGWNQYKYSGDDPVDNSDASGLATVSPCAVGPRRFIINGKNMCLGGNPSNASLKHAFVAACGIRGGWAAGKEMLVRRGLIKVGSKFVPIFDVPCAAYGAWDGLSWLFGG